MLFQDRSDAGQQLAEQLAKFRDDHPIVLALPRGGVTVGFEVARALGAPLDVLVVRKLNAPSHPELGIGAIAPGGVRVLDDQAIAVFRVSEEQLEQITEAETAELERRLHCFRGDRPFPNLRDRTVILVDDGLATGVTAQAAVQSIRQQEVRRLVLAVPVCSPQTAAAIRPLVEEFVCAATPLNLISVGYWYHDFAQLSDEQVVALLDQAAHLTRERATDRSLNLQPSTLNPPPSNRPLTRRRQTAGREQSVQIPVGAVVLEGDLALPEAAVGVVLFAHGSGSGRQSPRGRAVAEQLWTAELATLTLDLLTPEEATVDAQTREYRFDIERLAGRLVAAADWLALRPETRPLPMALYGASTGAAAALMTAAERPTLVGAVVSRGGRPDLAGTALERVQAPTLLLVGGQDIPTLRLNREAYQSLSVEKKLVVIPGAGHLFEEPGALEEVARLSAAWFTRCLAGG